MKGHNDDNNNNIKVPSTLLDDAIFLPLKLLSNLGGTRSIVAFLVSKNVRPE